MVSVLNKHPLTDWSNCKQLTFHGLLHFLNARVHIHPPHPTHFPTTPTAPTPSISINMIMWRRYLNRCFTALFVGWMLIMYNWVMYASVCLALWNAMFCVKIIMYKMSLIHSCLFYIYMTQCQKVCMKSGHSRSEKKRKKKKEEKRRRRKKESKKK